MNRAKYRISFLFLKKVASSIFVVGLLTPSLEASCVKQLRYPSKVVQSIGSVKYFKTVSVIEAMLPRNRDELIQRYGVGRPESFYVNHGMEIIKQAYEDILNLHRLVPEDDIFYQPILKTKQSLGQLMGHVHKHLRLREEYFIHSVSNKGRVVYETQEKFLEASEEARLDLVFGLIGSAVGALGELKMGLILPGFHSQGLRVFELLNENEYRALVNKFGVEYADHLLSLEIDLIYEGGRKWGEVKNKRNMTGKEFKRLEERAEEMRLLLDFLKTQGRDIKYEYFFLGMSPSLKRLKALKKLKMNGYGARQVSIYMSETMSLLEKN